MTFAKFDQSHTDDERWMAAGADAFAVHVAAVVWCDRQLTDGAITGAMAARVSLAVPAERSSAAVAALLEHGFWTRIVGGDLQIVDYDGHCFSAEEVRRTRASWAMSKKRKRQHDVGDHALCDPEKCRAAGALSTMDSVRDSTADSRGESGRLYQIQPDSTRPDRREGSGKGKGGGDSTSSDGSAPLAASSPPPPSHVEEWDGDGAPPGVVPSIEVTDGRNGKAIRW